MNNRSNTPTSVTAYASEFRILYSQLQSTPLNNNNNTQMLYGFDRIQDCYNVPIIGVNDLCNGEFKLTQYTPEFTGNWPVW